MRLPSLFVWLVSVSPALAAPPDPQSLDIPAADRERARELVRKLGSPSFIEREAAQVELAAMKRRALPALSAAERTTVDAEIRWRTELLLPAAETDDLRARAAMFLSDADGKFDHELPAWEPFRAVVGSDTAARALFADIVRERTNHPILLAVRKPGEDLRRLIVARRQELLARVYNPHRTTGDNRPASVAEAAALVFAECLASKEVDAEQSWTGGYATPTLFRQTDFSASARGEGSTGPAVRKLAIQWINTRDGPAGLQAAVNVAQSLSLKPTETEAMYGRLLTNADPNLRWLQAQALSYFGRTRDRDMLAVVRKVFDDNRVLVAAVEQPGYVQPEVQMRDFALVVALHLTKQKPLEYGFKLVPDRLESPLTDFGMLHFADDPKSTADQKRAAAAKQFQAWLAAGK